MAAQQFPNRVLIIRVSSWLSLALGWLSSEHAAWGNAGMKKSDPVVSQMGSGFVDSGGSLVILAFCTLECKTSYRLEYSINPVVREVLLFLMAPSKSIIILLPSTYWAILPIAVLLGTYLVGLQSGVPKIHLPGQVSLLYLS